MMKKIFYFIATLMIWLGAFPQDIRANETVKPLPVLVDGRTWVHITYNFFDVAQTHLRITRVLGDDVVGGIPCKLIEETIGDKVTRYYAREDNGIVYLYGHNEIENEISGTPEFWPVLDFNLKAGESAGNLSILDEDILEVEGVKRRRLKISTGSYWIEGIGASNPEHCITPFPIQSNNVFTFLLSCWDANSYETYCIFQRDDIFSDGSPLADAISNCVNSAPDNQKYDLNGHKIEKIIPGEVYIQNGKKIIDK